VAWFFQASSVVGIALERGSKNQNANNSTGESFERGDLGQVSVFGSLLGCLDGVKIGIQKPSDDMKQSHFYNGWTYDHYVANLFLFTPNDCICAAYVNSPGKIHDSTMASTSKIYCETDGMYDLMNGMAKVVVDSAFASEARDSMIKSYQTHQGSNGQLRQDQRVNNEATDIQQMVEWRT